MTVVQDLQSQVCIFTVFLTVNQVSQRSRFHAATLQCSLCLETGCLLHLIQVLCQYSLPDFQHVLLVILTTYLM